MRILIVDDDESSRYLLATIFRDAGHETPQAPDGASGLEAARADPPDLVVSDILMPGMDGYQFCRLWRLDPLLATRPFVFYSANYTDAEDERFARRLGADEFLVKPMEPSDLLSAIERILERRRTNGGESLPADVDEGDMLREYNARLVHQLEQQLLETQTANRELVAARDNLQSTIEKLTAMVDGTVRAIAKIVEARDPYTSGHQERVSALAAAIAEDMGLDPDVAAGIRVAGLVHDVGKINVPSEILTKPRHLTPEEFELVKLHPEVARDILSGIDFPWPVTEYVVQHHERLDGSGYPHGLSGEAIAIGSRVLAVSDVVEAMSSHRPYKVAAGLEAALDEIQQNKGVLYDADVVDSCVRVFVEGRFVLPKVNSLI